MNLRKLFYLSALSALFSIVGCTKKENPVEPAVNHRPVIERIVANPQEPYTEDTSRLECIVNDGDNDDLYYDWRCDGGYFNTVDSREVIWNSPRGVGTYHLTVKVDDRRENGTTSRIIPLSVISRCDTVLVAEDAFVDEYVPRSNSQNDSTGYNHLWILEDSLGVVQSDLKFNLNLGKEIRSAKLRLTLMPTEVEPEGNRNLLCDLHKITESWNSNTITWENRPDHDILPVQRFNIPIYLRSPNPFYVEGLSGLVSFWINNSLQNHGLMITPLEWNLSKRLYSREGAKEIGKEREYSPALILVYE